MRSTHSGSPANGITAQGRARSLAIRAEKAAWRVAQRVDLGAGVVVYPDMAPGVGWVLQRPGYPNRYLATKDQAVAHYGTLQSLFADKI